MGKTGTIAATGGAGLGLLVVGLIADACGGLGLGSAVAAYAVKGLALGAGGAAGNAVWDGLKAGASEVQQRLRDPKDRLANHDLQALAGRAIAAVLAASAQDCPGGRAGRDYLARAAKRFPEAWSKVTLDGRYGELLDQEIPKFFGRIDGGKPEATALDEKLWQDLVGSLANVEVNDDELKALEHAARRLHEQFPKALFELAKEDFAPGSTGSPHDGKAFAAVLLTLVRDSMAGIGDLLTTQQELLTGQESIVAELKKLSAALAERGERIAGLTPEDVAAIVGPIKDEIGTLRDDILDRLTRIEDDARTAAEQARIAAAAAVDNRDLLRSYGFGPLIAPNLPPLPLGYVERPGPMARLAAAFQAGGRANVTGRAQASAAGGYGKSVLAFAYAHAHRDRYSGGVFVATCEGRSVVAALTPLLPDHEGVRSLSAEVKAAIVRAKLSAGEPTLLILDNIDSAEQWRAYRDSKLLPSSPCDVLITTRADDIKDVPTVPVERLEAAEAMALLAHYRPSAGLPENSAAIACILQETERIAALVAAVGMAMAEDGRDDWPAYAEWLAGAQPDALPDAGDWIAAYRDYPHKTAAILDDLRRRLRPASLRALDYAALLPADMIARGWLEALVEADMLPDRGELALPVERDTTGEPRPASWFVQRLRDADLLRRFGADDTLWSLHRLHRKRALDHFEAEPDRCTALRLTLAAYAAARRDAIVGRNADGSERHVDDPAALTDLSLRWELAPLAALCRELWSHHPGPAARVGVWLASVLKDLGRYAEAAACLPLSPATDAAVEAELGLEDFAVCYSNRAVIQRFQDELPGARSNMERAIAIAESSLGPEHPKVATMRSNLAVIQQYLGDLPGALANMERAIAIDEKHFAADHPTLAIRYSNLALIQQELGDLPGARANMLQTIEIMTTNYGPDHPHVAVALNNLAHIAVDEGNIPEAVALWRKSYPIRLKALGPEHPYTKGDAAMLRKYDPQGP